MVSLVLAGLVALGLSRVVAKDEADGGYTTKSSKVAAFVAEDRRVLIISIDGLRPDLALLADMPNFRSLMKKGAYSMWAQTLPVGITLPSHTSMLTGVPLEIHGVFWNDDTPIRKRRYDHPHVPTLFEFAKEEGYTTALVAGKYKFIALAKPGSVDHLVLPEQPQRPVANVKQPPVIRDENGLTSYDREFDNAWVGEQAAKIIAEHKPQVMTVHFPRVDSVGHAKGWGTPEQLNAIEIADQAMGVVLQALRDAKIFDKTLIIVTSDHGGMGKVHNGKDPRGLHIPWVVHGPGIRKGYDLTQHQSLTVSTMDTFGTAAFHLGLSFSSDDDIEGKVVREAFEPVVKKTDAK